MNWYNDQILEIIDYPININVNGTIPNYIIGNYLHVGPSVKYTIKVNYTNYIGKQIIIIIQIIYINTNYIYKL